MVAMRTRVSSYHTGLPDEVTYLAIIYSVGYETRSTFVAKQFASSGRLLGLTFPAQREGHFAENLRWGEANGRVLDIEIEDSFPQSLRDAVLADLRSFAEFEPNRRPRILVDISSMTRRRIADCLRVLYESLDFEVDVDWVYAPATFDGSGIEGQAIVTNAAVAGFEGWGDPSLPVACIVGTGFEGDLALGVIDDIEPEDVWALVPQGYSLAHDSQMLRLNNTFLATVEPTKVLPYRVDQPLETLLRLDALIGGEIGSRRVVLIPLGPKIFALVCALVALSAPESVTLWRVSSEATRASHDRKPDGAIVGLTVSSFIDTSFG